MTDRIVVKLERVLQLADPGVWGPEDNENGISVLRSTNFSDDGTLDLSNRTMRSIPTRKREAKLLKDGDIILERSGGGPNKPVGRVCYFLGDDHPHLFGNFCQRLRARPDVCNSRFLFWYLYWFHATGNTLRFQKQTTGIRNLEYKRFISHEFSVPAISEQERIVAILDQADSLCRQRIGADHMMQRVLPALFHKVIGDPVVNPKGWPLKRLDDVVEIGTQLVDPNSPAYLDLPHIGGENIEKNTGRLIDPQLVRDSDLRSSKFHFTDKHLLYSKIRPYLNKVAYPRFEGVCSADIYPLGMKDPEVSPWYILALLRTSAFLAYAKVHSGRLRMPKLNRKELGAFLVPIPDPPVQESFVSAAMEIERIQTRCLDQQDRTETVMDVLLHRAFSGELTAKWREANREKLEAEMRKQQLKLENANSAKPKKRRKAKAT